MDPPRERHFRFGVFQAYPTSGELWKSSRRFALQDQPFRILVLLLQRGGELVTREELKNALWPSANYGDFDEGVNTAVMKLRQARRLCLESPIHRDYAAQGISFHCTHCYHRIPS